MQETENPVTGEHVKAQVEHDRISDRVRELEAELARARELVREIYEEEKRTPLCLPIRMNWAAWCKDAEAALSESRPQ